MWIPARVHVFVFESVSVLLACLSARVQSAKYLENRIQTKTKM